MSDSSGATIPPRHVAGYGSWASPITAGLIAESGVGLSGLLSAGGDLFWSELRPLEGGRQVIVRRDSAGDVRDVTPPGFNARTLVHEYGGGAVAVHRNGDTLIVFFSNFDDQRLYRQESASGEGPMGPPRPITPEPPAARAFRYADARVTPDGTRVICVHERHDAGEVVNELVAVPADGSGEPLVLATGHDFYAAPRLSRDGTRLAWLSWDHPHMPWDETELWTAQLTPGGGLSGHRRVAGGPGVSVLQPGWSPDGRLHFVSDQTGWWNLYRDDDDSGEALAPRSAEFAKPSWVFGLQNYAFLPDGRLVAFWSEDGRDRIGVLGPNGAAAALEHIPCAFTTFGALVAVDGGALAVLGGGPEQGTTIALLDPASGELREVRRASQVRIDAGYLSRPEPIRFPTSYDTDSVAGPVLEELAVSGGSISAHALYYPPANKDFVAPADERPPLLVISHGGPTSASEAILSPGIQYWTSRGIAVVDVNYGGSSGYGRAYRERLKGNWGVVDTVDCINAARFLTERGDADPARLAIRGGSAGGYTTLNALTRHRFFAAGASLFGLADLEMFVTGGTHKFESRYLLGLVGPHPEAADLYRERSPIHHVDDLSCPVIVLQGLDDEIVPPAQADLIVAALERNGLPHAYLAFEGEQHGFRKAENIIRSFEAELFFYGVVFGFEPADDLEPVEMRNA